MKEKLIKLVDLKSIITLALTIALIIFTYIGIIPNELFITVTSSVFTYFFTKKSSIEKNEEKIEN